MVTYIKHRECLGSCATRNTGLSHSDGYYVAFIDDDEWLHEKIEEQLKDITDINISLVYCGCQIADEIQRKESEKRVFSKRLCFQLIS